LGDRLSKIVDQIIEDLNRCKTVVEVNVTAKHYRDMVKAMDIDPKLRVRAIHIRNLAAYMRSGLMRDK
jgi:hypothetical protein